MYEIEDLSKTIRRRISATINISCQNVFIVLATLLISTVAVDTAPVQATSEATTYLSQFGYLSATVENPSNNGLLDNSTWTKAIQDFQGFVGVNVTGELDKKSLQLMALPRCGVKDKVEFVTDNRSKRYALQGSYWQVKGLTFKISKYPKRLKKADVDVEVSRAFNVWSDVTDLTFTPKETGPVDIEIRFEESEHGDGNPFDGPNGILAHANSPITGGDVHFDDTEDWTIGSPRGTNLFQVAAHGFGHSLGISHSNVRSALMTPVYRGFDPVFKLDIDDVLAIQALYGKKNYNSFCLRILFIYNICLHY